MTSPALARVVRRETHSPRTVAMFVAVIILILALAYVGLEIVLRLLGQPALLLGPGAGLAWLVGLPTATPGGVLATAGAVLAVIGLIFVVLAITPGRLSKHEMTWDNRAVVVDNGVIAAALAQHLSDETGLPRDQISVGVAHRSVDVTVRPGAGIPLDESKVRSIADAEIAEYRLVPSVKTRVRVDRPKESEWEK
ncbi:DNA/RNA endonuclease G [Microbacterium sp. P01]|uniref:DNA/RNA endonuclease G n=1 Tax=unclassified Microbacterium TaxID=2609290 RepID=UPI00366FFA0C